MPARPIWPLMSKLPLPKTFTRDVPLVESLKNKICPPSPPFVPPFAISVAELGVATPANMVMPPPAPLTVPPLFVMTLSLALALSKRVNPPPAPLTMAPLFVIVALAAVAVLEKSANPPRAPLAKPPLLIKVAFAAVEPPINRVPPPLKNALLTAAPLLVKVALAAEALAAEVPEKDVSPPPAPMTVAPLLMMIAFPALVPAKNNVAPPPAFAAVRALEVSGVPPRKMGDIVAGRGADREQVRHVHSFKDLWKAAQDPASVRGVVSFHDAFASLVFGHSMLERLSADGRLRSRLFCGGYGKKVGYLQNWLSALKGSHFKVTLVQPLFHVLAWLTKRNQVSEFDPTDWARETFGVRAPSSQQVRLAQAVFDGFLWGHREWMLWQFVGRATRKSVELRDLDLWRKELGSRYPAIDRWHQSLFDYFWRDVGGDSIYGAHREHDGPVYRAYVESQLHKVLDYVSALVAMAVENAVVARFFDGLLCEGNKPKAVPLSEKLEAKLLDAFPGARFQVKIEALP
jgi:hypothetical protein